MGEGHVGVWCRVGIHVHEISDIGWCRLARKRCAWRVCGVEREVVLGGILSGSIQVRGVKDIRWYGLVKNEYKKDSPICMIPIHFGGWTWDIIRNIGRNLDGHILGCGHSANCTNATLSATFNPERGVSTKEGICSSDHSCLGKLDIELSFSSRPGKMLWHADYGNPKMVERSVGATDNSFKVTRANW